MASAASISDLYGSSTLRSRGPKMLPHVLPKVSSALAGSVGLGFNDGDPLCGEVFNFSPGGDPGHALTFGATRSGKGVSAIIPALLSYTGSMLVLDPKLENAWITAEYRRQIGQRVVILDPWDEINQRYGSQVGVVETVTRFNPLSALDPKSPDFNDDVSAMADALTVRSAEMESHWIDSARELIAGLIAAAVEQDPGKASLREVRELVTGSDETLVRTINSIHETNPNSLAARKLRRFLPRKNNAGELVTSNEIGSIRSTAETQTAFLDSERLLEAMETDDPPFNLADLATQRVTLYVGLPVDRLQTHGRWLRLIMTLAVRAISRQKRPPELPVLFMLDEFGTISPGSGLPMIEQSFGLMAGLGIRVWAFLQDLPQLQRDYPKSWETFISNSSLLQVLNCADATTSEYFSRYLGTTTVNSKTGGMSYRQVQWVGNDYTQLVNQETAKIFDAGGPWDPNNDMRRDLLKKDQKYRGMQAKLQAIEELKQDGKTVYYNTRWTPDEQLASRPVMFPTELRELKDDSVLLIFPRRGNFLLKRLEYFSDPDLSVRARQDPNKPPAKIKERPTPPPPPAANPTPPPAAATPPPAPAPAPPSAAATAGAVAGMFGRFAAKAGEAIKQKVEEKIDEARNKKG